MTTQLTIFSTGITCSYCKQDPGRKEGGVVWDGFLDKDTNQYVCFPCQFTHYHAKSKTEYNNLYSEFPVIIQP